MEAESENHDFCSNLAFFAKSTLFSKASRQSFDSGETPDLTARKEIAQNSIQGQGQHFLGSRTINVATPFFGRCSGTM